MRITEHANAARGAERDQLRHFGETTPPRSEPTPNFFWDPASGDMRSVGQHEHVAATVAATLDTEGTTPSSRTARRASCSTPGHRRHV